MKWVYGRRYQEAIAQGGARFDLFGNPCGEGTNRHIDHAKALLLKMNNQINRIKQNCFTEIWGDGKINIDRDGDFMKKRERIICNVTASMAMEGHILTQADKTRMIRCLQDKTSFATTVQELVSKHRRK